MGRGPTARLVRAASARELVADAQAVECHSPMRVGRPSGGGRSTGLGVNRTAETGSALLASVLAEAVGFEPTMPFQACPISSRVQSTTLPCLRGTRDSQVAEIDCVAFRAESPQLTGFEDGRLKPLGHASNSDLLRF